MRADARCGWFSRRNQLQFGAVCAPYEQATQKNRRTPRTSIRFEYKDAWPSPMLLTPGRVRGTGLCHVGSWVPSEVPVPAEECGRARADNHQGPSFCGTQRMKQETVHAYAQAQDSQARHDTPYSAHRADLVSFSDRSVPGYDRQSRTGRENLTLVLPRN